MSRAPPTLVVPSSPRGLFPRGNTTRNSFLTKLTNKAVSVVPFAPERLSITQTVLTPTISDAIARAGADEDRKRSTQSEEASASTLFAALKMRRALQRAKAGRRASNLDAPLTEAQANVDRHVKVLSRYRIRRITNEEDEAKYLRNLGRLVNPRSTVYRMWQLGTLILIIYQSIVLPYALAFGGSGNTVIDTVTNIIFGLDIVIQFNTPVAGSDEDTEYVTDRWEIARIYCRGWLFFDVLACIPFDSLLLWINQYDSPGSGNNLNVLGLLKAMRIPRLLRIIRVLRVLKILKINPEIRRWLQYSRHANLLRLVRLVASFLIINHYIACIWYGAIESDELKSQDENKSTVHLYISSFYTSLLMIMGQNITLYTDREYVFSVAAMLFGSVLQAVVFGNVAMLIANYYENQSSHQKKMEWLFASMSRMKLPLDLQNRINDYYQAMWERHGTLDGAVTAFIPELSRNLAYEVELFLRMDMINRAPIFQSCSAKVVQELVMELELQVFMPGDYVVVRGEVGNDMYFVQNGICEVTKEVNPQTTQSFSPSVQAVPPDVVINEIVLKTLGQGDYFGEIALLMNCKRTANVRAQVFSELCALTRDVFENISLRYLEDRNIIEKFIMDKYDPSMLQAAMKQSQELSMRTLGVGPRPSILRRSATPSIDADAIDILRRIEERIHKLEQRIEKDGEERRESELRQSRIDSNMSSTLDDHIGSSRNPRSDYVLFEPERVSQRNMLAPIGRPSDKAAEISKVADSVINGEATEDHPDQKKQVWKRPSVHRAGSWRNARREGSADSLRLRGLVKPYASYATRHSSRATSITAAVATAEASSVQHSLLHGEPSARSSPEAEAVDRDDISADTLDDLANTLAQIDSRHASRQASRQLHLGPTLETV